MATVNASKYGYGYAQSELGWMTARDATTANGIYNQPSNSNLRIIRVNYEAGSKSTQWGVYRGWFAFDVTAYQTGYTITNLKLYYLPTTSTSGSGGAGMKMALVKSTAQGNADADLTTSDFNNFDDTVDYAANDGSTDNTWRDLNTLSSVDLNATAISAITSTGYLKICIMEYLYDYPDTAPTTNPTDIYAYCNFSTIPYLSFTATPTGWSDGDINSTTSPEEKINGVEYTNIIRVNSIPQTWNSFSGVSSGVTYTIYYVGALANLSVGSVLYSNSSGATALPAGTYSGFDVDVFGCSVASGCSYCIINSNGEVTEASPPCCP